MKKIWVSGKPPNKGSVVEFRLNDGRRVVGYYTGYDKQKDCFGVMQVSVGVDDINFVRRENVFNAFVFAMRQI